MYKVSFLLYSYIIFLGLKFLVLSSICTHHNKSYVQMKPLAEHPEIAGHHKVVRDDVKDLTPFLQYSINDNLL